MTLWMPGYQSRGALDAAVATGPSTLTGLVAWYKADTGVTTSSGNVTAVADQSGHGYNLTNTGTVALNATGFNGYPAFDFLTSNSAYLNSSAATVALSGTTGSCFIVGQMKTGTMSNGSGGVLYWEWSSQ